VQRASTTVVVVVGRETGGVLRALDRAANVRVLDLDDEAPPLDRAVEATRLAASAHIPYLVHDADPLAVVADAWVRFFDGEGPIGELEVAVTETRARLRTGAIELPDYYAVLDPETLDETRRHFWLGVVHRDVPARVVPVPSDPDALLSALGALTPGRWWSPADELLEGLDRAVPDQVGAGRS